MGLFQDRLDLKIDNKDFVVNLPCIGASILWEDEFGKSVNNMDVSSVREIAFFIYALLKACNRKTFSYSFEDFQEVWDKNQKEIGKVFTYLLKKKKK